MSDIEFDISSDDRGSGGSFSQGKMILDTDMLASVMLDKTTNKYGQIEFELELGLKNGVFLNTKYADEALDIYNKVAEAKGLTQILDYEVVTRYRYENGNIIDKSCVVKHIKEEGLR